MSARACEVIRRLEALLQANKNNFSMIAFLCFNPPHKHPLPRRQRRRRERCGRTKRTTESRPLSTPVSTVFLLPPSTKTYRTAHDPKVLTRGSQPATIRSTQMAVDHEHEPPTASATCTSLSGSSRSFSIHQIAST